MVTTSSLPNTVLVLTTHAHLPPLRPAPQLKYDLRAVPNPPKAIRDAYTGVSKRLRDHMFDHEAFLELLELAEAEIRVEMKSMIELWIVNNETVNEDGKYKGSKEDGSPDDRINKGDYDMEDKLEAKGESSAESIVDDQLVLTVGISCARGQHRSVAFAEELSRRSWPKNWEIITVHRDLGQKRSGGKNHTSRDRRIREVDMFNDE